MSTTLLHQVFKTSDQECIQTEYKNGAITFYIQTKDSKLQCGWCNSFNVSKKSDYTKIFRIDSIESKPIFLNAVIQRLVCRDCGLIRQEKASYSDEMYLYQWGQELYNSNIQGLYH